MRIQDASGAGQRTFEHIHALGLALTSRDADVRRMIASITVKDGWFNQMHPIEWFVHRNYSSSRAAYIFKPLRPGSGADLVVLDANPLHDIRNTQRIHSVTVRGRFMGPDERQRMLAEVERVAQEGPADGGTVRRTGCCH